MLRSRPRGSLQQPEKSKLYLSDPEWLYRQIPLPPPVLSPMQNPSDRESEYFNQPLSLNSISQQHAAIQIVKNASSPLKDGEI